MSALRQTAKSAPTDASRRITSRRALEALRAGVPNRDAVAALGSLQTGVEDRFSQLLESVRSSAEGAGSTEATAGGPGMLIGGGPSRKHPSPH